jgi:ankyrin repeat protein
MNWHEEQKEKLYEDHKSGKITTPEFNDKLEALDRLINKTEHVSIVGVFKSKIVLSITFILIAITCFFILKETLFSLLVKDQLDVLDVMKIKRISKNDPDFVKLCKEGTSQQIISAIRNKANVDASGTGDLQGWTTLMLVAANKNANSEVMRTLVKAGARVNEKGVNGSTPLIIAAKHSTNPEVFTTLRELGADINAKDNSGKMAIDYVKENEILKYTEALWNLDDSYVLNPGGTSLTLSDSGFIELCKSGSLQQINGAIANRANVNARDKGWTSLMAAAGENSDPEVTAALIKAGADVNATNISGRTPLILAAGNNSNPEVIKTLIDSGADVNPKTDGNTPLMAAAGDNPNSEAITILIKAGADVNAVNISGKTPLLLAAKNNPNPEVIKILIKAGADVNVKDIDGKTPLIMAADNRNPNPEMITALIKAGGDVNERDKFGLSPLMLAAGNENSTSEVITAVVKTDTSNNKASVNINALDENGKTPLIEAAQKNSNPKVIITLLQLGASTIVKDDAGKTAVDYARENRRLNDADTLQKLQSKEYAIPLNASKQRRAAMSDYSFLELCKNGTLQRINNAIKNGANVNARNSTGETPLMLAAGNNSNPEVIAVLVNAGADVKKKNSQGSMVMDYLRRNERLRISITRSLENRIRASHTDSTLQKNTAKRNGKFIEPPPYTSSERSKFFNINNYTLFGNASVNNRLVRNIDAKSGFRFNFYHYTDTSQSATLRVRYANGGFTRGAVITVNGEKFYVLFQSTGTWNSTSEVSVRNVTLKPGVNDVEVRGGYSTQYAPDFGAIEIISR